MKDSLPNKKKSEEHLTQLPKATTPASQAKKKIKGQQLTVQQAQEAVNQAEQQLSLEKDFIRATMNSLREGVIVTDLDGIIYYTNPALHNLLKTKPKTNANKPIHDILLLKTDESLPIKLTDTNKSIHKTDQQIAFIEHEDGSKSTVEWSRSFITNNEAKRLGLVFTINDVTTAYNLNNQ